MSKPRHVLPMSLVEKMWEAYRVDQSERAVARVAGVSRTTANRYINYGDEFRGVEAFITRYNKLTQKTADKSDRDVVKVRTENVQLAAELKAKYWKALRAKEINPEKVKPGDFDTICRLEMFLIGEPDKITEHRMIAVEAPRVPPALARALAKVMLQYEIDNNISLVDNVIDVEAKVVAALPGPKADAQAP